MRRRPLGATDPMQSSQPVAERPRPARVDEGARAERGLALLRGPRAHPRPAACTRSARRPAARTSPSAGGAAPRPSRSSATPARAPAATATSTPASPSTRPTRSSRCASRTPRRRWASSTSSSRRSTATTCPTGAPAHYAATIRALKTSCPRRRVEVLTPDFLGVEEEALARRARRAAGGLQPQHRDRPAPAPARCAARRPPTTRRSGSSRARRRSPTTRC